MKVCLAATSFPRWPGDGHGAFIWGLAHALHSLGVEIEVTTLHAPESSTADCLEGISVHRPRYWWPVSAERLKQDVGGLPITLRRYMLARLQLPVFMLVHTASIARLAMSADIIHAHWTISGAAALLACVWQHRPVIITIHGSDVFQVPALPGGSWLTRAILKRADRVTAVSKAIADAAASIGVPREHIRIIPNGVDTNYFHPPNPDTRCAILSTGITILFVGSLIQRKGVRFLFEALSGLLHNRPSARLVVIGDGPEAGRLRQQAQDLEIAANVEFLGFLPQAGIRNWMQRAHLFVLPSLEEGHGVVLLEALACGTPIVASDVGGMREIVAPDVGIRVPPKDPPALKHAMDQILTDTARWTAMSYAARARAEAIFSWPATAKEFIALYSELLYQ